MTHSLSLDLEPTASLAGQGAPRSAHLCSPALGLHTHTTTSADSTAGEDSEPCACTRSALHQLSYKSRLPLLLMLAEDPGVPWGLLNICTHIPRKWIPASVKIRSTLWEEFVRKSLGICPTLASRQNSPAADLNSPQFHSGNLTT